MRLHEIPRAGATDSSPASPILPAPSQGDIHALPPATPTPPAPSALLPRPLPGTGSVRGDTWWEAVSGVEPAGNRIRLFPTYPHAVDRVDIATGGEADGEGELVPPPLSLTLQPSYFLPATPPAPSPAGYPDTSTGTPTPPAPRWGIPIRFCRRPPPHPRLRRSSPAPSWGRGPCPGVYQESSRIRGGAGGPPCSGFLRDLAVHWTMVTMCDRQ